LADGIRTETALGELGNVGRKEEEDEEEEGEEEEEEEAEEEEGDVVEETGIEEEEDVEEDGERESESVEVAGNNKDELAEPVLPLSSPCSINSSAEGSAVETDVVLAPPPGVTSASSKLGETSPPSPTKAGCEYPMELLTLIRSPSSFPALSGDGGE
jgi:hypothetical protein